VTSPRLTTVGVVRVSADPGPPRPPSSERAQAAPARPFASATSKSTETRRGLSGIPLASLFVSRRPAPTLTNHTSTLRSRSDDSQRNRKIILVQREHT
jgi:hypothetical protein